MRTQNLNDRMKALIENKIEDHRKFKILEQRTSIPSDSWKNWSHDRQRPTMEMIEAVAKLWPEYAFWLATGATDYRFGHIGIEHDSEERNALLWMGEWSSKTSDETKQHLRDIISISSKIATGGENGYLSQSDKLTLEYLSERRLNDVKYAQKLREIELAKEWEEENSGLRNLPNFLPEAEKK